MTLTSKQLINLPVVTESGIKIGKVGYLEFNEKDHTIEKYAVKTSGIMQLIPAILLIAPKQIIEISSEQMVVEENTFKSLKNQSKQNKKPVEDPSPVLFIDLTENKSN